MTYRRDLLGDVDRLGDGQHALLDGALEVDVLGLLAQAGRGGQQPDQPVLDDELDVRAVLDRLVHGASRADLELDAASKHKCQPVSRAARRQQ